MVAQQHNAGEAVSGLPGMNAEELKQVQPARDSELLTELSGFLSGLSDEEYSEFVSDLMAEQIKAQKAEEVPVPDWLQEYLDSLSDDALCALYKKVLGRKLIKDRKEAAARGDAVALLQGLSDETLIEIMVQLIKAGYEI